jgi:uncharacterized membrane protein YkvA (DUF1232 family)
MNQKRTHVYARQRIHTFILIMALLYILSPIDLIPDVIPVVGWLDDAAVAVGAGALALGAGRRP